MNPDIIRQKIEMLNKRKEEINSYVDLMLEELVKSRVEKLKVDEINQDKIKILQQFKEGFKETNKKLIIADQIQKIDLEIQSLEDELSG